MAFQTNQYQPGSGSRHLAEFFHGAYIWHSNYVILHCFLGGEEDDDLVRFVKF